MNRTRQFLFALVFVTAIGFVTEAKDWRGFVPLQSTRADVHRIMGAPQPPPDDRPMNYEQTADSDTYYLPEGEVHFVYASADDQQNTVRPNAIKPETLLLIRFTPDHPLDWSDVSLFESDFRNYTPQDADGNWNHGFTNDVEGIVVSLFAGKIIELVYTPGIQDRTRIPGYLAPPEQIVKAQNFGQAPDDGSARRPLCTCYENDVAQLDMLAYELTREPESRGYIITYTDGNETAEGQPNCRENALSYLTEKRQIKPDRFVLVDGGPSLGRYMELWLVPQGEEPPLPTPDGQNMPGPGICEGIVD